MALKITKRKGCSMAQMPKGKPRSVPDPDGDRYDEVVRQDRRRREAVELAQGKPWPSLAEMSSGAMPHILGENDFEAIRRTPRPNVVSIGGQTYNAVDNGRANVLVPLPPMVSPAELAERRRGIARVEFMMNSPIGSTAYDLATLANASPRARDGALALGGVIDAAIGGLAFRGAPTFVGASRQQRAAEPPGFLRPNVRNSGVNEEGQAQGLNATITESMLGTGTEANRRIKPPGWQGHGTRHNEGRMHLLGAQLGGSGRKPEDIVTGTQNPTNSSFMKRFENKVARWVRDGEIVEQFVKPLYSAGMDRPHWVLMSAFGSRGSSDARLIQNLPRRRK